MRISSITGMTGILVGCLFLAMIATGVQATGQSPSAASAESSPGTLELSQAQKDKWIRMQNQAERDYRACTEHCGSEGACLDKCNRAHQNRLDREYQTLLAE